PGYSDGLFARPVPIANFDVNSELGGRGLHCHADKLPEFWRVIGVDERDLNIATPGRRRSAGENGTNEKAAKPRARRNHGNMTYRLCVAPGRSCIVCILAKRPSATPSNPG